MANRKIKRVKLGTLGVNTSFAYTEAFKTLRTNLEFLSSTNHCKKLIITSSIAGEGKTNVSMNLAATLAEAGKKVIFVDCDLRQSVLKSYLQTEQGAQTKAFAKGLSGVLSGKSDL